MTTAVWTNRSDLDAVADNALKAVARLWFFVVVLGQWAFLYYILAFYGPSTLTGNFEAWSRNSMLRKGYVEGDSVGNLLFAAHALLAGVVTFGGVLQLVPQIRARALAFHRWNGRVFLVTAIAVSLAGLSMTWLRGSGGDLSGDIAITLNALLIFLFGGLAWRAAREGEMATHRRWALRTFLVVNGVWFIRIGFGAWMLIDRASLGTFFQVWSYGCYLVPLGMLELYLRAKHEAGPAGRFALAGALLLLTALMGLGIFGFSMISRSLLLG